MLGLSTREIIIIAVVIVLLFGSSRIPELAKNIVEAIRSLTGALKGEDSTDADKKK